MSSLPTYVYPLLLAVIAAIGGRLMVGRDNDPRSIGGWVLYAVAIGCVILGLVFWWMDKNY